MCSPRQSNIIIIYGNDDQKNKNENVCTITKKLTAALVKNSFVIAFAYLQICCQDMKLMAAVMNHQISIFTTLNVQYQTINLINHSSCSIKIPVRAEKKRFVIFQRGFLPSVQVNSKQLYYVQLMFQSVTEFIVHL